MPHLFRLTAGPICLALLAVHATAAVTPGQAELLNINGALDLRWDTTVAIAAGQNGRLVAVWESHEDIGGLIGSEPDILFAVSDDHGVMWTFPAPLNTDAATDGIFVDQAPAIATDGAGTWVAVWQKTENLTGIGGANWDIYFARSTDNGLTWSAAAPIHSNAGADTEDDEFPTIATDGDGNWIVTWQSSEPIAPATGADTEILAVRSSDNGATWTVPGVVNHYAGSDSSYDDMPVVATDGDGLWIVAWESPNSLGNTSGVDADIVYARSLNNGATWSNAALLNANGATDFQVDEEVSLAYGDGVWMAVWQSNDHLGSSIGQDRDVLSARSLDGGLTWSPVVTVNTTAATDTGNDDQPHLATDGLGNWIAAWRSNENIGGTVNTDLDIFCARSTNDGATWTDPILVNSYGADALSLDWNPFVVTDGVGNWVIAWDASETTLGTDRDIWRSTFFLGNPFADLTGVVLHVDTLEPVTDAAVIAVPLDGGETVNVVTDLNGRYRMIELPAGPYTVTAYSATYDAQARSVSIGDGRNAVRNFRLLPTDFAGTIVGDVVDLYTNRLIGGAQITVEVGLEEIGVTHTGADGRYTLSVLTGAKAPLDAVVTGRAKNFGAVSLSVTADTATSTEGNLVMGSGLLASATLSGTVTTQGAATPIANARVTAIGPVIWSAIADGFGAFTLELPPGAYRLEASAAGHTGVQTAIVIADTATWNPALPAGIPTIDFRDVNDDGLVNAVDVQNVINAALGADTPADTDINGDTVANAVDVQLAINGALGVNK